MMKICTISVTHYQQNCSLLWCEKTSEAAFVDPGGDIDRLMAAADQYGVTVAKILLTHGHMDHVGGTAELSKRLSVPVIGPHRDDAFWINDLKGQAQMMGFPPVEAFEPDQWLNEGDTVTVGESTLSVHHCPGHTPGHVVFFQKDVGVAFVGDVLFKGSIGRTDFPRGDYDQLVTSIRTKLWPLGDEVTFIPGHGPTSTFGDERRNNAFVADNRFG